MSQPLETISSALAKLDDKTRYSIMGGVLLLIFLLDYFFVMNLQLKTLGAINPDIFQKSQDIRKAREDIAKLGQYNQEIAKLTVQLDKANHRVITKEEVSWVLDNLSRLAADEKIKIDQIMPIKGSESVLLTNKDGKYYSLPIMVTARCSYHDLGRFLNKVENGNVFLTMNDFSIISSGDDTSRHVVKLTFKVVVFEKLEEAIP